MANENPEKNMSFKLDPTAAVRLQQSIAALGDREFNPKGLGIVEFTEQGFEITVRNPKTKALGKLSLNPSGLIDFHCKNPVVGKNINLNQILKNGVGDGTITISHLFGSNHLSFIFGWNPNKEVKVELLDMDDEFERFVDMDYCCEIVLKSMILWNLLKQLPEHGKTVSLGISPKLVSVGVGGNHRSWSVQIHEHDENFEARVLIDAKDCNAWFKLEHAKAMKKALTVAPKFCVRLDYEPKGNIMMRFKLEEAGELVFLHKANIIVKNPTNYNLIKSFENNSEFLRLFGVGIKPKRF